MRERSEPILRGLREPYAFALLFSPEGAESKPESVVMRMPVPSVSSGTGARVSENVESAFVSF